MPTWEDFQHRHVLNPNTDPGVDGWNKQDWNNWLRNRLPGDYGKKDINSIVVVSTEEQIIAAFRSPPEPEIYRGDLVWSNDRFLIYFLKKTYNKQNGAYEYSVKRLPKFFFVAALDEQNRPKHFHGQNEEKTTGNLPKTFPGFPEIN